LSCDGLPPEARIEKFHPAAGIIVCASVHKRWGVAEYSPAMVATVIHAIAVEVERLAAADLAAAQRYDEAMKSGDMSAARIAADEWMKAADALADYVAKHPDLYRATG